MRTSVRPCVEEAKVMLEREGFLFLDIRTWKAYDREHITKPPKCTANVPLADGEVPGDGFVENVGKKFRSSAKLLIADDDGSRAQAAADALLAAGYADVVAVEGGYDAWMKIFTTSGQGLTLFMLQLKFKPLHYLFFNLKLQAVCPRTH